MEQHLMLKADDIPSTFSEVADAVGIVGGVVLALFVAFLVYVLDIHQH